jgi:SpoVK/Ycf46/Vps4 family AAA+-type ATPase
VKRQRFIVEKIEPPGRDRDVMIPYLFHWTTKLVLRDPVSGTDSPPTLRWKPRELTFPGIIGHESPLAQLQTDITLPSRFPILIEGVAGTGKTSILDRLQVAPWGKVLSMDSTCFTKPKTNLTRLFADAAANQPALVLIDDLDERTKSIEPYEFSTCLQDQINQMSNFEIRIVATARKVSDLHNRLQAIFRLKTYLNLPTTNDRLEILNLFSHSSKSYRCDRETIDRISRQTHAFTGRDLEDLWAKAMSLAHRRLNLPIANGETLSPSVLRHSGSTESQSVESQVTISWEDFTGALKTVHASAMSEIYIDIPQVSWSDVAGSESLKQKLNLAIQMTTTVCRILMNLNSSSRLIRSSKRSISSRVVGY